MAAINMSAKSKALAFKLRSWKSIAPQVNDTKTLERRIIETTEIIASASERAKRYATSAADKKSEIRGIAHDQWNGSALPCLRTLKKVNMIIVILISTA